MDIASDAQFDDFIVVYCFGKHVGVEYRRKVGGLLGGAWTTRRVMAVRNRDRVEHFTNPRHHDNWIFACL